MVYIIISIVTALLSFAWLLLFYKIHKDIDYSQFEEKRKLEREKYHKGL